MITPNRFIFFVAIVMILLAPGSGLSLGATPVSSAYGAVDGEWVLAANSPYADLCAYNVKTGQVVSHLAGGVLGTTGGGLFDIAITPDGKTAIVSNFGDSRINFLDISNPLAPKLLGIGHVGFFAEDLDITADGKFVLVTDGGFSSRIAVFDIQSRQQLPQRDFWPAQFQSVAVSPNGTVVGADYWNAALQIATIDGNGWINHVGSIKLWPYNSTNLMSRAVNVGIAPDGQTVIMVSASTSYVTIFKITGKGHVEFTGFVMGLPGGQPDHAENSGGGQSVAFSPDGKKAYLLRQEAVTPWGKRWWLSTLNILGPGVVELDDPYAYQLYAGGTSQLFGVDTITYASGKIIVGNPTLSGGNYFLQDVDLDHHTVEKVGGPNKGFLPTSVATIPITTTPPPPPVISGPTISSIGSKTYHAGSKATLWGTGFSLTKADNVIAFDGTTVQSRNFTVKSTTNIRFTIPKLAPGSYMVTITVDGIASNQYDFEIK